MNTRISKKTLVAALAAAALCLLLIISPWHRKSSNTEKEKIPVSLNEVLTNEMSDTSDLAGLDKSISIYMQQNNIHGASLAIMKNDSLVYAKGYGEADDDKAMTPGTIMRIASVSKLITATGIMVLQEQGKLSLRDTVFGPSGILSRYDNVIKDKSYRKITVEHLLRHQAGFSVRGGDPMFSTRDVMRQYRLDIPPDHETLMYCLLKRRLSFQPGTSESYSNLGYLILSLIIEEVTGERYEDWMQENVIKKAGCNDMHIAHNYYKEKYPNETRYFMQSNDPMVQCYDGTDTMVERCYGGNDIEALSGAGAWVSSAPELMKFVASIDGRPEVPDIISEESVREMTRFIDKNTFSLGWNDTEDKWSRTGSFSGTSALVHYYPDGECWIIIFNTSTWRGTRQSSYTAGLFKRSRERFSSLLPERDFFYYHE